MPRSGRGAAVALAAVAALALSACTAPANSGPVTPPSASASPRATAVFGSDDEALAAATAAYSAYLAMSARVNESGGEGANRLADVATGDALKQELASAALFREKGLRSVGQTKFDSLRLQQISDSSEMRVRVTAYVCSDVTSVDVVGPQGTSVVPADRVARFPLQVEFVNLVPLSNRLILEKSLTWSGANFC